MHTFAPLSSDGNTGSPCHKGSKGHHALTPAPLRLEYMVTYRNHVSKTRHASSSGVEGDGCHNAKSRGLDRCIVPASASAGRDRHQIAQIRGLVKCIVPSSAIGWKRSSPKCQNRARQMFCPCLNSRLQLEEIVAKMPK
jgi:hypothetical protein